MLYFLILIFQKTTFMNDRLADGLVIWWELIRVIGARKRRRRCERDECKRRWRQTYSALPKVLDDMLRALPCSHIERLTRCRCGFRGGTRTQLRCVATRLYAWRRFSVIRPPYASFPAFHCISLFYIPHLRHTNSPYYMLWDNILCHPIPKPTPISVLPGNEHWGEGSPPKACIGKR